MNAGQMDFAGRMTGKNDLEKAGKTFFQTHAGLNLMGSGIWNLIREEPPERRFDTFLAACGYENDAFGFFSKISDRIKARLPVIINKVQIPVVFLVFLLKTAHPGDGFATITRLDQIHSLDRTGHGRNENLEKILDIYPVRLSDHVVRQSMVSRPVADQYLPFEGELDPWGLPSTFEGHSRKGIIEQMYQNRVIFLLGMECPVYCRFCFRKHKDLRREKSPGREDIRAALAQVEKNGDIREVLITGGEPFLYLKNLETALDGLADINHIQVIRIATRSISYYPGLFLKNREKLIQFLLEKNSMVREKGKQMEIGAHFIHPDEISVQSLEIISRLIRSGIRVYLQTPFLKGINSEGSVLADLFSRLRNMGVKIYYIFTPCHPIQGTKKFQTTITEAMGAFQYLRAHLSDRAIPKLCTATSLGKIEWQTSGWAVEPESEFIWIRTPYTLDYFSKFTSDTGVLPHVRENNEGTLDVRMLAQTGDSHLFKGSRSTGCSFKEKGSGSTGPIPERSEPDSLEMIQESGLIGTIRRSLVRAHKTRVELDLSAGTEEFAYIQSHPEITDVVIRGLDLKEPDLARLENLIQGLRESEHLFCIRICCAGFARYPDIRNLLNRMVRWSRLSLSDPLRLEMETWFIHPREITAAHEKAAREIRACGLEIYANVPLISGINNTPPIMVDMAHRLRQAGIEFHHMYLAGLPVQNRFNREIPLETGTIIDIASQIRKECSGREIPLYVIHTPLGEVDFGL